MGQKLQMPGYMSDDEILPISGVDGMEFFVRGDGVYMHMVGGKHMLVGFVKNGIAYNSLKTGKPSIIGEVIYK